MHESEPQIIKITKKYIIDYLNALCFENTISWAGCDQVNEMPLFTDEDDGGQKQEQRGALLVHKRYPHAFRMLITIAETAKQQVCYRITDIKKQIKLDDPNRKVIPFSDMHLDLSIADLNLGLEEVSSYSFCDNINGNKDRIISLLKFLLDCFVIVVEEKNIFEDLLLDMEVKFQCLVMLIINLFMEWRKNEYCRIRFISYWDRFLCIRSF